MEVKKPRSETPKEKSSFKKWFKKHLAAIVLIVAASVIAAVFIVAVNSVKYDENLPTISTKRKPAPVKYYSPLTGLPVADEAATKLPVTGIMIENSPESRPQSGLKNAGVVYEAVAEGGITRFMALYQGAKPALIGPVLSLRIYYLNWAAAYQASIAHVGSSPNADECLSERDSRFVQYPQTPFLSHGPPYICHDVFE